MTTCPVRSIKRAGRRRSARPVKKDGDTMAIHRDIEEAADSLRMMEPTFLQKTAHGYICPVCNQGANKGNGVTRHSSNKELWYCVSCEKARSIFGLYAAHEGIPDDAAHYPEIVKGVARYYGAEIRDGHSSSGTSMQPQQPRPAKAPEQVQDYTADIERWHNSLLQDADALEYLHRRGIDDTAIEHFKLGFARSWKHSKTLWRDDRIIIPRSSSCFSARKIRDTGNGSPKYQIEGSMKTLFNAGCLQDIDDGMPIVIVEGELDAVAIWQTDHSEVIGLGSASNAEYFVSQAKAYKGKNPGAVYILAIDNDDDGRKAQKKIAAGLEQAGILYIDADTAELYDGAKDASEAAQKDADGLVKRLIALYDKGYQLRADSSLQAANSVEAVSAFLQKIRTRAYEPIPTGIADLDAALGGGLIAQTLVTLQAAPGVGKSALCQQMLEGMAEKKIANVIYFTLEMSKEQVIARSLSRVTGYSQLEILRGYNWTMEMEEDITIAACWYQQHIAPRVCFNPPDKDGNSGSAVYQDILDAMRIQAERLKKTDPDRQLIVCVDYLQLLKDRYRGSDAAQIVKDSLKALKDFATDERYDAVVIAILAQNRDANEKGTATMSGARDSSAAEYSSDVMLAMTFGAIADGTYSRPADMAAAVREGKEDSNIFDKRCISVIKNRMYEANKNIYLMFDGKRSRFTQIAKDYQEDYQRSRSTRRL